MAKRLKKSLNFRQTIEDRQVDYIAALRDGALFDLYGIPVELQIPKIENNVDEYQNFKDEDFDKHKVIVVPKFKEYRQIVSKYGMTTEEDIEYPLEIAVPSALHVPKNSRILLSEYDADENKIGREWRVLSSTTKQLSNSKSYTKLLYCVPARTNVMVTSTVDIVKSNLYMEPLEKEDVIIYSIPQQISIITYCQVSIKAKPPVERLIKVMDTSCISTVKVLSASVFNN